MNFRPAIFQCIRTCREFGGWRTLVLGHLLGALWFVATMWPFVHYVYGLW